jgi:hypothetical protein
MSGRGFVDFFVISPKKRTPYTQQCLLNQASPFKNATMQGMWVTWHQPGLWEPRLKIDWK